jgi:hypothetical protein
MKMREIMTVMEATERTIEVPGFREVSVVITPDGATAHARAKIGSHVYFFTLLFRSTEEGWRERILNRRIETMMGDLVTGQARFADLVDAASDAVVQWLNAQSNNAAVN